MSWWRSVREQCVEWMEAHRVASCELMRHVVLLFCILLYCNIGWILVRWAALKCTKLQLMLICFISAYSAITLRLPVIATNSGQCIEQMMWIKLVLDTQQSIKVDTMIVLLEVRILEVSLTGISFVTMRDCRSHPPHSNNLPHLARSLRVMVWRS